MCSAIFFNYVASNFEYLVGKYLQAKRLICESIANVKNKDILKILSSSSNDIVDML